MVSSIMLAKITPDELACLTATKTAAEWSEVEAAMRQARGGYLPPDWYAKVTHPGVREAAEKRWV